MHRQSSPRRSIAAIAARSTGTFVPPLAVPFALPSRIRSWRWWESSLGQLCSFSLRSVGPSESNSSSRARQNAWLIRCLLYSVANIPTTSVTGATTAGQDGTAASAPNTSNRAFATSLSLTLQADPSSLPVLYIALSFGFSLAVNAWIFFRVSGGLFNPAVSLGMAIAGALTPLRAIFLTISQILGGIVGAAIIQALLPGTLNVATKLSPGTSVARGLFLEMFLTALLMLAM